MTFMLSHLDNGWEVDQAILSEEDRVVLIRFGHDGDEQCLAQDQILYQIQNDVQKFAVIYVVDITQVPDFNELYELYDPMTLMFFYRNKHIMVDTGTVISEKQELIDILELVYRGASKGKGLVTSIRDYSTKLKY